MLESLEKYVDHSFIINKCNLKNNVNNSFLYIFLSNFKTVLLTFHGKCTSKLLTSGVS